jgi:hypothetical protein
MISPEASKGGFLLRWIAQHQYSYLQRDRVEWVESPPKCPKLGKEVAFEIANRNTGFF